MTVFTKCSYKDLILLSLVMHRPDLQLEEKPLEEVLVPLGSPINDCYYVCENCAAKSAYEPAFQNIDLCFSMRGKE